MDQCLERHAMADLATRVNLTPQSEGTDAVFRLIEAGHWDDLCVLAKFNQILAGETKLPIENTLIKKLLKESHRLKLFLDDPESDEELPSFQATHCATELLHQHPEFTKLSLQLQKFFDFRTELIKRIETQEQPELQKKYLLCLSRTPGQCNPAERFWKDIGPCPENVQNRWAPKSKDERCQALVDMFFLQKTIPKILLQRRDLASYLFRQHFWSKEGLKPDIQKTYLEAFQKALKLKSACSLELLRTQEPGKAKKILFQLHWLQCLLPPTSIVDFSSAYFEFRFLPPSSQPEERIKALTQAEQQMPSSAMWLSTPKEERPKLLPYLQGLEKRIAQTKAQAYLSDDRTSRALESILHGVKHDWPWSIDMLKTHSHDFLPLIQDSTDDDQCYYTNLLISKHRHEHPDLDSHIEKAAATRYDHSAKLIEEPEDDTLFTGAAELSRAIQLGFPENEAQGLYTQYINLIDEAKDRKLQSLSLEVGSALGEVLSTRSLSSEQNSHVAQGNVGDHLQKLYENFKDVMLQQDPFANDTQQALKDILNQAQSLVEEAKSIEASRSTTVMDDILLAEDKESHRILIEDKKSIKVTIEELLLQFQGQASESSKENHKIPIEQSLMQLYTDLLVHISTRQIKVKNNPLLQHFGHELVHWINHGFATPKWWGNTSQHYDLVNDFFKTQPTEDLPNISTDRYIISFMYQWIRFENEEALKVPYRKAMSIVCSHITNGIVSTRKLAQEMFNDLLNKLKPIDPQGQIQQIAESMRKASSQISSLEIMKKGGILPIKFDRSIEPRVRAFLETCSKNLAQISPQAFKFLQEQAPKVYELDRAEFMLGTILSDKEKALKRYLHMNLDELTQSYLRSSNKGSLQNKITNTCLRVQQGINFRRSDARNLRYAPVVPDDGFKHTPASIEKRLNEFEEMFPIIDRISGSRQFIQEEELVFTPDTHVFSKEGLNLYKDLIDRYLNNALKLARQLRIIVIPGQGTGNYDPTTHTLCIPEHTGLGRSEDMTLLSALADYLYHVKIVNEGAEVEEELCALINKKSKSSFKPGSHDTKLKITNLLYQELGALAGVERLQRNPPNISSVLGKAILGTDQTMIYRDMRELSAPQKQQRYKNLRARYACDKRIIPFLERVADVAATYLDDSDLTQSYKKQYPLRVYHRLSETCRQLIKDEIYDLAVLLYHYGAINDAYQIFEVLTQAEPDFPESYWGLATSARHAEMNLVAPTQKQATAIGAFKRFGSMKQVGPFWKKRANELSKKLSEEMV